MAQVGGKKCVIKELRKKKIYGSPLETSLYIYISSDPFFL